MEIESSSKRIKLSSNSMLKLSIENKLKNIINDIDVETELKLMKISDESTINSINFQRNVMIKEIEKIIRLNLESFERNLSTLNVDDTKEENLFENYCVYFDTDLLSAGIANKDRLGLLIILDYFVPDSQIKILKDDLRMFLDVFGTSKANARQIFFENLYVLHQVRNSFANNSSIISINKKKISDIKEISIDGTYQFCVASYNPLFFYIDTRVTIPHRFHKLKSLSISEFKIRTVYKDFLMHLLDLEELNLSRNQIEIIEKDAFSNLKSLKKLNLSRNHLKRLKPGSFDYLAKLEELNLSYNGLSIIFGTLFKNLTSLKKLEISKIGLQELKNGTLSGCVNLHELNIEFNDCAYATDSFSKLKDLSIIKLAYDYTELTKNKTNINGPSNLRELYYYFKSEHTPHLNWISKHSNLKVLDLSIGSSKLNQTFFNEFALLEQLVLSHAKLNIEKFPKKLNQLKIIELNEVFFQKSVEKLFIFLNDLKEVVIKKCIFKKETDFNKIFSLGLSSVQKFTLKLGNVTRDDYSSLSEVVNTRYAYKIKMDESITRKISNLTELVLTKNSLNSTYEHTFKGLINLQKLIIKNNELNTLGEHMFDGLVNLKYLDISKNHFKSINEKIFDPLENTLEELLMRDCDLKNNDLIKFENLKAVKVLNISLNKIEKVTNRTFRNFHKLVSLDISSNHIKSMDKNVFSFLNNLKILNLSENKLTELDGEVFNGIENIEEINISNTDLRSIDVLFSKLLKVQTINAIKTQIESVDLEKIGNLNSLNTICLQNCQIREMNFKLLSWLLNKKGDTFVIRLYRNPFCKIAYESDKTMKFCFKD